MLLTLPRLSIGPSLSRLRPIRPRNLNHKVLDIVDAVREAQLVGWIGTVELEGAGLAYGPVS
jgi:hypothetical protein